MADYRKFWLTNTLGNKYLLTDNPDVKVFFNNPRGFGLSRQYDSIKVGNSELVESQEFRLTDISGQIVFYEGSNGLNYEKYNEFIQFVKYKPLEFHYQTPNSFTSNYCDVLLTSLSKDEIDKDGTLRVTAQFHRLTEWLNDNDIVYVLRNVSTGNGKYYDLVRPYHYSGTSLSNTPINNNGTDDVGFIIEIDGEVQNPQFTLTQFGEQYGICRINGTYTFVSINSVEKYESIYLERNGSAITNPEQYQDFTIRNGSAYLTWCKFRVGETNFTFTCGNIDTFDGTMTIKFKNSYASV